MKIFTFDTTLRDGTQGEAVSFSVDDKLLIAQKLDELGIDYIEGGWPGSNPKDKEFFARAADLKLKHARLTAFGSTRFAKNPVDEDRNVRALVEAGTPGGLDLRQELGPARPARLGITEEENLKLISDTVRYLKDHGKEVVYDAEHFFDGYTANPDFALRTLEAAQESRRRRALPVRHQRRHADRHASPRSSPTCASTSTASSASTRTTIPTSRSPTRWPRSKPGATHVQGCMNGYGERCGNANLASIIANLELKLGHTTIGPEKLASLATRLPLHRRAGQSAAAQRSALRRPERLRAQGRRARQRGAEGFGHLRAHHARTGRQPPARAAERSLRPRQHPLQAQAARPGRPPGRRRPPRAARAHQADGVRGLRAGSRRGHLRTAGPRSAASRPALLRRGELRSHHPRRRHEPPLHRHRHPQGAGRRPLGHRDRPRSGERAATSACASASRRSIRRSPTSA